MNYGKFILFGDSITQYSSQVLDGFSLQAALQDKYIRKLDIINRGFSGYNSKHATLILPKLLDAELNGDRDNVKLMTIFFGTNDAFEGNNDIQPVSLENYSRNINTLVELALKNNIRPIVIGPTFHDSRLAKKGLTSMESVTREATNNERNYQYNNAARQVAEAHNVAFVDLWDIFRESQDWTKEQLFAAKEDNEHWEIGSLLEQLVHDGVHFTGKAYRLMFAGIMDAIEKHYPELLPNKMPMKLADWKVIDPSDLNTIFTTTSYSRE